MLTLDTLTSFVLSGAGSLVAAAMTLLVRPDERHLLDGLRICRVAFLVVGIGMFAVVLGVEQPTDLPIVVAMTASTLGVGMFTWGLARLGNERVPRGPALAVLVAVLLVFAAARLVGGWAVSHAFMALTTVLSLLAVGVQRSMILRPSNLPERTLGVAVVTFAAAMLVRAAFAIAYTGPQLPHHLHMPSVAMPVFAVYYGIMPIFLATVVLTVINARLSERLEQRAMTDELTGLLTRRALRELAPETIRHARHDHLALAVLMIDIDRFKAVNDRHGHLVGDDVLRQTASSLRAQLRADALLTRFGGEEFAAVVPVPDAAHALQLAERLRLAVAQRPCLTATLTLPVTVSIGLSMLASTELLDAAIMCADEALYRAKDAGRNRVEVSVAAPT